MEFLHGKKFFTKTFPLPLSLYKEAPQGFMEIEKLEKIGLERLNILKIIAKGSNTNFQYIYDQIIHTFRDKFSKIHIKEAIEKDIIGHYLLRLSFSQDDVSKSFLIQF